jgi:hypothetical protein
LEKRRKALTEEKFDDTGARMEHLSKKSLQKLVEKSGASVSSAKTAKNYENFAV